MKEPRRSSLETKIDMLKVLLEYSQLDGAYRKRFAPRTEILPSRLMFAANLSWQMLQRLLPGMISAGLIANRTVKAQRFYSLTEKGKQAIKLFDELARLVEEKPITVQEY